MLFTKKLSTFFESYPHFKKSYPHLKIPILLFLFYFETLLNKIAIFFNFKNSQNQENCILYYTKFGKNSEFGRTFQKFARTFPKFARTFNIERERERERERESKKNCGKLFGREQNERESTNQKRNKKK